MVKSIRLVAALVVCSPTYLLAAPFQNGSFEPGPRQLIPWSQSTEGWVELNPPPASQLISGWIVESSVSWHSDTNAFGNLAELRPADNGRWFVDLKSDPDDPLGRISQTFDTMLGAKYRVSFSLSAPGLNFANPRIVDVWTDPTEVHSFGTSPSLPNNLAWTDKSFDFTATSGETSLTFRAGSTSAGNGQYWGAVIDGVTVAQLVPEPHSILVAATAVFLLLAPRRRTRSMNI